LSKTPAQWQADARKRLQEQGGAVITFKATPGTVEFLERHKQQGIGPAEAINNLVAGSSRKLRSKQ